MAQLFDLRLLCERTHVSFKDTCAGFVACLEPVVSGESVKPVAFRLATIRILPFAEAKVRFVFQAHGLRVDKETRSVVVNLPPLEADRPVRVAFEMGWPRGVPGSLGVIRFRARAAETSQQIEIDQVIRPSVAGDRGAPNPDAVRHIIVAKAALVLDAASRSAAQPRKEVARGLAFNHEMLVRSARDAGIDQDGQVATALAVVAEARRCVASDAPDARSTWRSLVDASRAIRVLKAAMTIP